MKRSRECFGAKKQPENRGGLGSTMPQVSLGVTQVLILPNYCDAPRLGIDRARFFIHFYRVSITCFIYVARTTLLIRCPSSFTDRKSVV